MKMLRLSQRKGESPETIIHVPTMKIRMINHRARTIMIGAYKKRLREMQRTGQHLEVNTSR